MLQQIIANRRTHNNDVQTNLSFMLKKATHTHMRKSDKTRLIMPIHHCNYYL